MLSARTELRDRQEYGVDPINRWRVNDLDTKCDLILAGGHRIRRTFLVTVEEDEHAQVWGLLLERQQTLMSSAANRRKLGGQVDLFAFAILGEDGLAIFLSNRARTLSSRSVIM